MSLERVIRFRHTLAFRLTFWYASIFVIISVLSIYLFYFLIGSIIRQRTDQDLIQQANELSVIYSIEGIDAVKRSAVLASQAAGEKKLFIRLLYPTGVAFSSTNMAYWKNIGVDREAVEMLFEGESYILKTISIKRYEHNIRVVYSHIGSLVVLQIGYSMETDGKLIEAFKNVFVFAVIVLSILSTLIGWGMAKGALKGVGAVTKTAQQISESDLNARVPSTGRGDEVDQLAITFNQMLDRIRQLVTGIREMGDHIAHDLKSPLTRIRGNAEVTLTGSKNLQDYQQMAGSTIEECDQLLDMINTMLVITKTEAGVTTYDHEKIRVGKMIQNACDLFAPLAEDQQIDLTFEIETDFTILGNRWMIQRLIANLIDNAIKYTPSSGKITICVQLKAGDEKNGLIQIEDTGIGMEATDLPLIFDRFFRCDQSRSLSGHGLGLSLAKAITDAHNGEIFVLSTKGKGSTFTIRLPLFRTPKKNSSSS